jgi:hypothetical protein
MCTSRSSTALFLSKLSPSDAMIILFLSKEKIPFVPRSLRLVIMAINKLVSDLIN